MTAGNSGVTASDIHDSRFDSALPCDSMVIPGRNPGWAVSLAPSHNVLARHQS